MNDSQDAAETNRRHHLQAAHRRIEVLSGVPLAQDSPTMRRALMCLMVGSHAYRHPLEHERTP